MWRTMKSKFAGTCKRCGHDFEAGTVIIWHSRTKYVAHRDCANPGRMLQRDAIRASLEEERAAFYRGIHAEREVMGNN